MSQRRTPLLLPLHCYDEAGRVKPPRLLWWCCGFLAKSLLIYVVALTVQGESRQFLDLFYANRQQFLLGLALSILPFFVVLLVSFRERWFNGRVSSLAHIIRPMLVLAVLLDITHLVFEAHHTKWQFSWSIALFILINGFWLYWLVTSTHLKLMEQDWNKRSDHH